MKIQPNQYYGYFDYDAEIFYVVCIRIAGAHNPRDWIGQRDVKFSDLLCIDDYIVNNLPCAVDWSKCHVSH